MTNQTDLFAYDTYQRMDCSAEISPCGKYRWWLRRAWNYGEGTCIFIGLNPSVADALKDDPTIRRCIGFAKAWGYSSMHVVNLFAWRATDPRELVGLTYLDATGGHRGDKELSDAWMAHLVIAAWGATVPFNRDKEALRLLSGKTLHCLGMTKSGAPRHPLYVPAVTKPIPFPE